MQLGADPNPDVPGNLIPGMIENRMDFSFIKQVVELLLNEKKEYKHTFNWDKFINQNVVFTTDTIEILCVKRNNSELVEYLCSKSKKL